MPSHVWISKIYSRRAVFHYTQQPVLPDALRNAPTLTVVNLVDGQTPLQEHVAQHSVTRPERDRIPGVCGSASQICGVQNPLQWWNMKKPLVPNLLMPFRGTECSYVGTVKRVYVKISVFLATPVFIAVNRFSVRWLGHCYGSFNCGLSCFIAFTPMAQPRSKSWLVQNFAKCAPTVFFGAQNNATNNNRIIILIVVYYNQQENALVLKAIQIYTFLYF